LTKLLIATLISSVVSGVSRNNTGAQDDLSLWLRAVEEHQTGRADNSAFEIARWSTSELQAVVAAVKKHVRSLEKDRRAEGNNTLLRGAALHADIARLIPGHMSTAVQDNVLIFGDGQHRGSGYSTIHWALGRSLLDAVAPTPASEPEVLIWYRDVSSYLLRTHTISEALPHLERARQIFPADAAMLLDSAYLHEILASPQIQAAVESLDPSRGFTPRVDSRRIELGRAERLFRQALAVEPDNADARVRLGRVVGQLGRHREAVAELRKAIGAGLAGESLYYAELFLGREEESLGNRTAARESYEKASKLYPRAQSPRLALSQLDWQSGDRAAALRALESMSNLPPHELEGDPWWTYYAVH
jgi:tetratricopeptide (TPR) repeat protein